MPDYIDRDAAIEAAEKYGCGNGSVLGRHCGIADDIAHQISLIPAVDAVPVIRCKDCKYFVKATVNDNGFTICGVSDMEIKPTDFCSHAENGTKGW